MIYGLIGFALVVLSLMMFKVYWSFEISKTEFQFSRNEKGKQNQK